MQAAARPDSKPCENQFSRFALQLAATAVLAAACYLGASWLKRSYDSLIPKRLSTLQENYQQHINRSAPVFWVELGKNAKVQEVRIENRNYRLTLDGFQIGTTWDRAISWSLRATGRATIGLQFENARPTRVGLYLTDGDSHWRTSSVWLGEELRIADRLHNGRWIELPVDTMSRAEGELHFNLNQLTGSDIAVSAVAVFEEE